MACGPAWPLPLKTKAWTKCCAAAAEVKRALHKGPVCMQSSFFHLRREQDVRVSALCLCFNFRAKSARWLSGISEESTLMSAPQSISCKNDLTRTCHSALTPVSLEVSVNEEHAGWGYSAAANQVWGRGDGSPASIVMCDCIMGLLWPLNKLYGIIKSD